MFNIGNKFYIVSIFTVSLMGGAIVPYLKNRLRFLYFILIIAAISSTVMYFRPKEYADANFFDKFLQIAMMHKGVDLTKDYLPIWVKTVDGEGFDVPRADKGVIKVSHIGRRTNALDFSINVISDSMIEIPITYFPGWEVRANNAVVTQSSPSKMGLIRFELPKGNYQIEIKLQDTPIRVIGNMISLLSALVVIFLWIK